MNILEVKKLKRICAKAVIQGPQHQNRMTRYFRIMVEAARENFNEDNKPTLDEFLRECFEDALKE